MVKTTLRLVPLSLMRLKSVKLPVSESEDRVMEREVLPCWESVVMKSPG